VSISKIISRTLLAGVLVASASTAEAVIAIIHDLRGSVGIVAGAQAARINLVRLDTPAAPDASALPSPCPVTLAFLDRHGKVIGDPNQRTFTAAGQTLSANFLGGPDTRPGTRVQVRGQVGIGDPGLFPGCRGRFAATVEVIDLATRRTELVLPSPAFEQ
jgi:hypothetical protein